MTTITIDRAVVEQALKRAYQLGQTYGQQADSDSWTQNKKSDETQVHFNALVTKTCEALQPQADTSVLQAAPWPPAGETLTEPEAMRYDFDGYGWKYIDNGSGSDWMTRHPEGEFLFTKPQTAAEPVSWMLRHRDVNDGKWYVTEKERYEAAEGVPGFERRELYTTPPAAQAALTAASDCRTCQHLSEAWGVCEARPKCVGGEQYVYFPEKQLWDKTPRNDGQAAHQEMREALYAEFNSAVGRQHD